MIAYMQVQEKMRSTPVPGMHTPKIQPKMADIFRALQNNRCQPESKYVDESGNQCDRADLYQSGIVKTTKGVDFFKTQGENGVQIRGQKNLDCIGDYGVKSGEVGSTDRNQLGNKRAEGPRQHISLKSIVITSENQI